MQVVLNEDVKGLGYRGEVVGVKPGYFRNFLLPKGFADVAIESRLRVADLRKDKLIMKKQQVAENAKEVLEKLKGLSVTINAKVSEKGKLYASIGEAEVVSAVLDAVRVQLEKSHIEMVHIKEIGEYKVKVKFGKGLEERITVMVEGE